MLEGFTGSGKGCRMNYRKLVRNHLAMNGVFFLLSFLFTFLFFSFLPLLFPGFFFVLSGFFLYSLYHPCPSVGGAATHTESSHAGVSGRRVRSKHMQGVGTIQSRG